MLFSTVESGLYFGVVVANACGVLLLALGMRDAIPRKLRGHRLAAAWLALEAPAVGLWFAGAHREITDFWFAFAVPTAGLLIASASARVHRRA